MENEVDQALHSSKLISISLDYKSMRDIMCELAIRLDSLNKDISQLKDTTEIDKKFELMQAQIDHFRAMGSDSANKNEDLNFPVFDEESVDKKLSDLRRTLSKEISNSRQKTVDEINKTIEESIENSRKTIVQDSLTAFPNSPAYADLTSKIEKVEKMAETAANNKIVERKIEVPERNITESVIQGSINADMSKRMKECEATIQTLRDEMNHSNAKMEIFENSFARTSDQLVNLENTLTELSERMSKTSVVNDERFTNLEKRYQQFKESVEADNNALRIFTGDNKGPIDPLEIIQSVTSSVMKKVTPSIDDALATSKNVDERVDRKLQEMDKLLASMKTTNEELGSFHERGTPYFQSTPQTTQQTAPQSTHQTAPQTQNNTASGTRTPTAPTTATHSAHDINVPSEEASTRIDTTEAVNIATSPFPESENPTPGMRTEATTPIKGRDFEQEIEDDKKIQILCEYTKTKTPFSLSPRELPEVKELRTHVTNNTKLIEELTQKVNELAVSVEKIKEGQEQLAASIPPEQPKKESPKPTPSHSPKTERKEEKHEIEKVIEIRKEPALTDKEKEALETASVAVPKIEQAQKDQSISITSLTNRMKDVEERVASIEEHLANPDPSVRMTPLVLSNLSSRVASVRQPPKEEIVVSSHNTGKDTPHNEPIEEVENTAKEPRIDTVSQTEYVSIETQVNALIDNPIQVTEMIDISANTTPTLRSAASTGRKLSKTNSAAESTTSARTEPVVKINTKPSSPSRSTAPKSPSNYQQETQAKEQNEAQPNEQPPESLEKLNTTPQNEANKEEVNEAEPEKATGPLPISQISNKQSSHSSGRIISPNTNRPGSAPKVKISPPVSSSISKPSRVLDSVSTSEDIVPPTLGISSPNRTDISNHASGPRTPSLSPKINSLSQTYAELEDTTQRMGDQLNDVCADITRLSSLQMDTSKELASLSTTATQTFDELRATTENQQKLINDLQRKLADAATIPTLRQVTSNFSQAIADFDKRLDVVNTILPTYVTRSDLNEILSHAAGVASGDNTAGATFGYRCLLCGKPANTTGMITESEVARLLGTPPNVPGRPEGKHVLQYGKEATIRASKTKKLPNLPPV